MYCITYAEVNKKGQRVIWVCPRNSVAEAVYQNAKKEVTALGFDQLTMELFLTGERKDGIGAAPDFASDIIVTNIDTILAPMVDNRKAVRLFTVLSSAIVLDEFHELASEQPLFAAFVTLMRARHLLCSDVSTLLLSATPSCLPFMWDSADKKTAWLPNETEHYPPAHSGTYEASVAAEMPAPLPGSLTIFNAISSCQEIFRAGSFDLLVHSRYTDADRAEIMKKVFAAFGKGGDGVAAGKKTVSALVLQAAMDISFQHLNESICSPEFTLQRIGRCDRWGTLQGGKPTIRLCTIASKAESAAIGTCYDRQLNAAWVAFLKAQLEKPRSLSLVELYQLYNQFCLAHGDEIKTYLKNCYGKGLAYLHTYFAPVKYKGAETGPETAGLRGRSLRSPFGSYFFSVRRVGGGWLGPDEVMSEGPRLRERFSSGADLRRLCDPAAMRVSVDLLYKAGFVRFRKFLKNKARFPDGLNVWFRLARSPETPLPDFTREYDDKLGL